MDQSTMEKILMGILMGIQKEQNIEEIKLTAIKALGNSI